MVRGYPDSYVTVKVHKCKAGGSSPASPRPAGSVSMLLTQADLIHAAGSGVALTLAATPREERDPRLAETMRKAMLTATTVPAAAEDPDEGRDAAPPAARVAVHAIALRALLTEASRVLSRQSDGCSVNG